jgi:hypothetical protein
MLFAVFGVKEYVILALAVVLVLFALVNIFLFFRKKILQRFALLRYFYPVVRKTAVYYDYYLINKLEIQLVSNESLFIDHMLFGNKYIYVINDYLFKGVLTGNAQDSKWILKDKKGQEIMVDSPLLKNKKLVEKLSLRTSLDHATFIAITLVSKDTKITDLEVNDSSNFVIDTRDFMKLILKIESRDIAPLNYFYDQPFLSSLMDIFTRFQAATSPEAYATLGDELLVLFQKYNDALNIFNQLLVIAGIIFIFNRGVFHVYLSIFIEHRPSYRFKDLKMQFLGNKKDRRKIFLMQSLMALFSFVLYTLLYIGSYFLIKTLAPSVMLFLQVELIALLAFAVILPFTTRFYYYYYHAFMEPKRVEILKFTIEELKEIIKNPTLPPEASNYISQILMMRQDELKARQEILEPKVEEAEKTEVNAEDTLEKSE